VHPIHHHYSPLWLMRAFNLLMSSSGLYLTIIPMVAGVFGVESNARITSLEQVKFLLYMFVLSLPIGILAGNFFTEVVSDAEGLRIKFLWKDLVVRWEDVIEVKPMFSWMPLKTRGPWVVRTHALTPFHRLYGLIYGLTFSPSFVYGHGISHADELTRRMKAAEKANRKRPQTEPTANISPEN
jgi:hypothetical protein